MQKRVYSWFNPPKSKPEKVSSDSQTVPNQIPTLKELLARHVSGQQITGISVDWNEDFPEDEIPFDKKQNFDLTDVDDQKRYIEEAKKKAAEAKKKLDKEEKILKNVPLNKNEADLGKGTDENISDIKTG